MVLRLSLIKVVNTKLYRVLRRNRGVVKVGVKVLGHLSVVEKEI